ncbi:MAG: metallophosphoesterase [Actinobacteria bacterium]|nr:metallophosphoesterase [Actinomycetota bacterium]
MRRCWAVLAALAFLGACGGDEGAVSARPGVFRFAAVADAGTGEVAQAEVIEQMCKLRARDPFTDVVQAGDNVYDHGAPEEIDEKFAEPFACLLDEGTEFHSVLGNHDIESDGGAAQIADPRFGMPGHNFTWSRGPVSFIMLDTNEPPGPEVLEWLDDAIDAAKDSPWTVAVFHHPPFSPGTKHGSSVELRELLADRLSEGGVDLVINGHEHLYARAEVDGVTYVVTGGGGRELTPCADPLLPPHEICRSVHEFVEFEATEDALRLTAHTSTGATIETHRVPRNP